MLGKLFKHEMKASSRLFIPLFTGFIAVTLLCKFSFESVVSMNFNLRILEIISGIFMILYFIYAVALFVMTSVFIVMHFYKTMVGDQGYLTHTLPAKTSTVINAKLFAAILWQIISCLFFILSIVVFLIGHISFTDLRQFMEEIQYLCSQVSPYLNIPVFILEVTLCVICSLISGPLMMYASIAVGHLARKNRVLWAIAAYFLIYIVMQFTATFILGMFGYHNITRGLRDAGHIIEQYMLFTTVFSIAFTAGFYAVADYIFSRRLNLE